MSKYKKLGGFMAKFILVFIFFVVFFGLGQKAHASQQDGDGGRIPEYYKTGGAQTTDVGCEWRNGAEITCRSFSKAGEAKYFYDPYLSFYAKRDDPQKRKTYVFNGQENEGYLIYYQVGENDLSNFSISTDYNNDQNGLIDVKASNVNNSQKDPRNNPAVCTIKGIPGASVGVNASPTDHCILASTGERFPGRDVTLEQAREFSKDQASGVSEGQGNQPPPKEESTCDKNAGTMSFVLCPLLGFINNQIAALIGGKDTYKATAESSQGLGGGEGQEKKGLFISFLEVNFNEPGLKRLAGAFLGLANALFILIFLVIIFSNTLSIGLDNYAIKKMLPKLVAGVILVQFTYFIVAALIDIFNFLGVAIVQIILAIPGAGKAVSGTGGGSLAESLGNGLGSKIGGGISGGAITAIGVFVVLTLAVVAIIAVLIAVVALIFRQFALVLLIVVAPLAFVAWVLPNTEKFFKAWWTNLLKLLMMYPLITGMIALSLMLAGMADSLFEKEDEYKKILLAAFPIVALILVPKTFKWGGQMMTATSGAVAGYLGGKAKGVATEAYKKSAKEGALAKAKGSAYFGLGRGISRVPGLRRFGGTALTKKGAGLRGAASKAEKEYFGNFTDEDLGKYNSIAKGNGKHGKSAALEIRKRYSEMADKQITWQNKTQQANPYFQNKLNDFKDQMKVVVNPEINWTRFNSETGKAEYNEPEHTPVPGFQPPRPGPQPPQPGPRPGGPQNIPSDIRLKHVFGIVGEFAKGIYIYRFSYKRQPDEEYIGLMAQELLNSDSYKQFVVSEDSGYYAIKYGELGFNFRRIK
ncbi:MAG: hypothetical protein Q8P54_01780 [bacterium]|nr:hypothetical protein [bacterium]